MKTVFKIIARTCSLLAFVIILTAPVLVAQPSGPAQLTGKVVDVNGAAIVGAEVKIASRTRTVTVFTDKDGMFAIKADPGAYKITVDAPGFAHVTQSLEVASGTSQSTEILLPVGETTAIVTIVATDAFGYRTDAVNTATRTLTSLRDTPQSINVIGHEQIRDQSLRSMSDVVSYVPGITSHQGENNRDQVVIRGVSSSADFFRDGVRDDVQYYRDLYNVDRVEILKGPNAMIFGRGGGGGVVNRAIKEAGFASLRDFTVQLGSFSTKRLSADIGHPLSHRVALRINSIYEKSGSFRRFVDLQRYGINPTVTFLPTASTKITLGYEHFSDRRVADRGIPSFKGRPANLAIDTFIGNPADSRVRADVNLLSSFFTHQAGRVTIRNRSLFGDYERSYQNYVPGAVNASQSLITVTAYNNSTKRRNFFNQTDLTYAVSTGRVKHTLLGGAELGRQTTRNFRNTGFFNNATTSIQVPYRDPVTSEPVTYRQSASDANNQVRANLAAVFAQDQVELSRRIQLVAGVRFDYFGLNFHNKRNGEELRRIDRLISPRFGMVIKPAMPVSVYGSYSVSYLPSSGDQFSSLTTVTQQVKPEKFTNYELGAKWDVRQLSFVAAVYRQDRTNTRATDPTDPTRIVQTGSQRTNGFEAGVSGNVTRAWSVSGGYAHQKAFITSATTAARQGAQVALVPRNTFSLWNKYRFVKRFAAGLGIVHRSDMFAAVDNAVTLPGYTKVDAAGYVNLAENWNFQVYFENLFNQKYYLNADGNNNISPGSPRQVKMTLVFGF